MARGSHSFTCQAHVYPRMDWAILHAFRKHLSDGVARARWHTSGSAYYSSIDPERMKGWFGLVGWPYSGWFTNISGHPSATGRAWDRKSLPVKDLCSITVPRSQPLSFRTECCYLPRTSCSVIRQLSPVQSLCTIFILICCDLCMLIFVSFFTKGLFLYLCSTFIVQC